jgi:hypothetical protein
MARSFNATSDRIAVNSAKIAAQGTAFAILLYVKCTAPATDRYLYSEGSSSSANPIFGIHDNGSSGGKLTFFLRNDANTTVLNYTATHVQYDGSWHTVIYSQDASNNVKIFTDGANKETTSYATTGTLTTDRATIGALVRSGAGNFYSGSAAHVALFARNLTDGEAASLGAGHMLPPAFNPSHYWPLWGVDSPEADLGSAAHVTGTLTGTSAVVGPSAPATLVSI